MTIMCTMISNSALDCRMSKRLFLKVVEAICASDYYFVQKADATGTLGLSNIQKCVAAIRMIGYIVPSDVTNEYTIAAKNTATESMKRFVRTIRIVYENNTYNNTHEKIWKNKCQSTKQKVGQVCLAQLIACITNGKIVQ